MLLSILLVDSLHKGLVMQQGILRHDLMEQRYVKLAKFLYSTITRCIIIRFILSLMIDDQEIIMYSLLVIVNCSEMSQQPNFSNAWQVYTILGTENVPTANLCSNICGTSLGCMKLQSLLVFSVISLSNLQIVVLNNKYLPPISIPSPSTTHFEEWQLTCSRIIHIGLGLYCTKIIPINASILKKIKNMGGRKIWPWICWFVLKKYEYVFACFILPPHWNETKWLPFCRRPLWMHFLEWKWMNFN